jgi:hypothetical protein
VDLSLLHPAFRNQFQCLYLQNPFRATRALQEDLSPSKIIHIFGDFRVLWALGTPTDRFVHLSKGAILGALPRRS